MMSHLQSETNNDLIDIANVFDYWFVNEKKPSLTTLALQEVDFLEHHTASEMKNKTSEFVWTQQRNIFQQLAAQDPVVYLLNVLLHHDHNLTLIVYSQPLVHTTHQTVSGHLFVSISVHDLLDENSVTNNALEGYMPLITESSDSCDMVLCGFIPRGEEDIWCQNLSKWQPIWISQVRLAWYLLGQSTMSNLIGKTMDRSQASEALRHFITSGPVRNVIRTHYVPQSGMLEYKTETLGGNATANVV